MRRRIGMNGNWKQSIGLRYFRVNLVQRHVHRFLIHILIDCNSLPDVYQVNCGSSSDKFKIKRYTLRLFYTNESFFRIKYILVFTNIFNMHNYPTFESHHFLHIKIWSCVRENERRRSMEIRVKVEYLVDDIAKSHGPSGLVGNPRSTRYPFSSR